jgi:hypothetical protein
MIIIFRLIILIIIINYNYMEIGELEDIDFDEVVKNHEENNIDEIGEAVLDIPEIVINLDEDDIMDYDIIYSYPYYSDTTHDYQFRITIKEDNYELEEIKADESDISDKNLKVLRSYGEKPSDHLYNSIDNTMDIRNDEPLVCEEHGIVNFDIDPSDSVQLKKCIERNKQLVLREIYDQIIEGYN